MCVGGGTSQQGRGRLHNIPFTHRTKRTSTESLLWLEVGSTGRDGSRLSLKKIQDCPPNMGAWGREIGLFNPKGIRSEAVCGGQSHQGCRGEEGESGLFGNWGKGTALPLLVPPAPPVWQGGGSLQPPRADTGL